MPVERPLWTPSPERAAATRMHAFMRRVNERHGVSADWESLRQWSIQRRDLFWPEMLDFAGIRAHTPASATCVGDRIQTARWFPGMTLNYAEHMLRFNDDRVAIHAEGESGEPRRITHRQLRTSVADFAAALRSVGVTRGDRVAALMPNIAETVIAMLATASLGAIWSSCSPDFGLNGVLDRFGQIGAKVLLTVDGYSYNGKPIALLDRVARIVDGLNGLKRVVIVPYLHDRPDITSVPSAVTWAEFTRPVDSRPLVFEPVDFDHALFIMYSSGTTGVPKCIVHGHGGTLLQQTKELMLHSDVGAGDTIFYFTTCGWMMWNWLVAALGVGATVVLLEGNPMFPRAGRLWEMAERVGMTHFGTSPKFIATCQKNDLHPGRQFDLSPLRCVLSTGSPLSREQFEWVYREVKGDLQLASICGGTDIVSCFMLGNPLLPIHAGEIQCRGLGMDVHVFDGDARPVIGRKGELVCLSPFPSRPVCFWNDADGEKYRSAYFDVYDGAWRHGDWIEITERGGVIVYGRSDATLNPGGVRIGTAEIYRIVEGIDEVVDSIVVPKNVHDDVEVCLFVVLREGGRLTDALLARIKSAIADGASKRHVPHHIRQVPAIPHTISGKKVELAVTQVIHGQEVRNRDALANPEALNHFRDLV
ncbi:MAG: acetoacetate--CoA ligase [Phycisphaerales bacterium]|nr:acetoacetate--CoA ligase [Phycisphaerales bacterium]